MADLNLFTSVYEIHGGGCVVICHSQHGDSIMTSPVDYQTGLAATIQDAETLASKMQKEMESAIGRRGDHVVTIAKKAVRAYRDSLMR